MDSNDAHPTPHTFQPLNNDQQHGYQSHHQAAAPVQNTPIGQLDSDVSDPLRPTPVVKVLSPVGVEYVFLTVTLLIGAASLIGVLISLVNGKTDFGVLAFPTATLTVTVPLFAALFLHLKKLEAQNPALRLDASKRRSTQFTQIAAFVVSLLTLIGFVTSVFAKLGGQSSLSVGKAFLNSLCILVVSGGILAYYWYDEHRNRR